MHYQTRRGASACWLAWLDSLLARLAWLVGFADDYVPSTSRKCTRVSSHACRPKSWIVQRLTSQLLPFHRWFFIRTGIGQTTLVWRGRCSSSTNQLVLLEQSDNVNWFFEEGQHLELDIIARLLPFDLLLKYRGFQRGNFTLFAREEMCHDGNISDSICNISVEISFHSLSTLLRSLFQDEYTYSRPVRECACKMFSH